MMTGAVRIVVDGAPVAKGRPKIGRLHNGRPVAFTPAKTRSYESFIRLLASQAMAGRAPMEGPVAMTLTAIFSVPASWSKRRRENALSGAERPTKKPDLSNVRKAAEDAMNGIVYIDDSQIVDTEDHKFYGPIARVVIEVSTA